MEDVEEAFFVVGGGAGADAAFGWAFGGAGVECVLAVAHVVSVLFVDDEGEALL